MTANKFKGACAVCNQTVPARAGTVAKVGQKWLVYCPTHKNHPAKPAEFLPDHFDMMVEDQMRDACGC